MLCGEARTVDGGDWAEPSVKDNRSLWEMFWAVDNSFPHPGGAKLNVEL